MAHGNLPGFPSLLGKQQRALVPLVAQILDPKPGDGADVGAGINVRPQDRPVPKPEHVGRLDRGEQLPGLLDRHLGGLSVSERIPDAANRLKGIEYRRVAADEGVEEVAQSGQSLVLVGGLVGELLDKAAGGSWRDLPQLESLGLAPGEKLADGPGVGAPGGGGLEICAEAREIPAWPRPFAARPRGNFADWTRPASRPSTTAEYSIENLDPSVSRFPTEKWSLPFEFSRYRGFAGDAFAPIHNGTSIDAKHLSGGLVKDGTVWAVAHFRPGQ